MHALFFALGIKATNSGTFSDQWLSETSDPTLTSFSPIDGAALAQITLTSERHYERVLQTSTQTFLEWRAEPAPKRGEVVRQIAETLRRHKQDLAMLITLECGKILSEAAGEVQEAIDIADFAVGLSRQLYGNAMHSERAKHRMYEQWHPLGPIAVITAFNFPLAVWAWNALVAAVCGDTVIWKPSEETPLVAIAATSLCGAVAAKNGFPGLFSLVNGSKELGQKIADDVRIPLVSATGSTAMGKDVAVRVAARLGRSLLELGGNNALIVMADADLELAAKAVCFGAAGTAGQRCTSTRRLLLAEEISEQFLSKLLSLYKSLPIGDPRDSSTRVGPLINLPAVKKYEDALRELSRQGGKIIYGGAILNNMPSALYVEPAVVLIGKDAAIIKEETFAPLLFVIKVKDLQEAISVHNAVPQGLSSAIFTDSLRTGEEFLSVSGSDCGIANVNIGTSGAEIGGAFGGEKDSGGGRESGSDSWRAYMRRQTTTINWGRELPLAQGVKFGE